MAYLKLRPGVKMLDRKLFKFFNNFRGANIHSQDLVVHLTSANQLADSVYINDFDGVQSSLPYFFLYLLSFCLFRRLLAYFSI